MSLLQCRNMNLSKVLKILPAQYSVQPELFIDLGSYSVKVLSQESNFFLEVPNCVVYHTQSGEVVSVGHEAMMKVGKLPPTQSMAWPVQRGVIADVAALQHVIEYIFHRFKEKNKMVAGIFFPRVVLSLPERSSEVELRALKKCWEQVGVSHLTYHSNGLAVAVASGVRVNESQGRVIVDIGFSCTQIFIISNGICIVYRKIFSAGDSWTKAIVRQVKHVHQVEISYETAESIKQELGVSPTGAIVSQEDSISKKTKNTRVPATVVRGRNMQTFFPTTVKVTQHDTTQALYFLISQLMTGIQETFADLPPALVADVMKYGIFLVGGSAILPGLKELLSKMLQIEVWTTDEPATATVRGLGMLEKK